MTASARSTNSSRSRWAELSSCAALFSTSAPMETCTSRSPLMVDVIVSHQAEGGTSRG